MRLRHSNASPMAKTAVRAGPAGVPSRRRGRHRHPDRRRASPRRRCRRRRRPAPSDLGEALRLHGRHDGTAGHRLDDRQRHRRRTRPEKWESRTATAEGASTAPARDDISSEPRMRPAEGGLRLHEPGPVRGLPGDRHEGGAAQQRRPAEAVGTFIKPAPEAADLTKAACRRVTSSSSAGRSATTTTPASTPATGRSGTPSTTTSRCRSTRSRRCTASYGNVLDGAYRYSARSAPPFSITTTSLPGGTLYSAIPQVVLGDPPRALRAIRRTSGRWRQRIQAAAPGLKLGTTGVISGRATKAGTSRSGPGGGHQDGGLPQGDGHQDPGDQDLVAGPAAASVPERADPDLRHHRSRPGLTDVGVTHRTRPTTEGNTTGRSSLRPSGRTRGLVPPARWRSPVRGPWLTSVFGAVLLVGIPIEFVTGLLSYAAYDPKLGNAPNSAKGIFGLYLFDWVPSRAGCTG